MDLNTKLLSAQPLRGFPQPSGDRGRTLCDNPVPSSNHAVKVIVGPPTTSNDFAEGALTETYLEKYRAT